MLKVRILDIDPFKFLFDAFLDFIESRRKNNAMKKEINVPALWEKLLSENRHDLIQKFRRVERKEGGFGTIVVPKKGFSKNEETNQLIIDWLIEKGVNVLNVEEEISDLEDALYL